MADKQMVLSRSKDLDALADEDPLAELARIVGFDSSSSVRAPVRREPEFDLEDELLREFERYDAPRLVPSDSLMTPPVETAQGAEPYFADRFAVEPQTGPLLEEAEPEIEVTPEPVFADGITDAEDEQPDIEAAATAYGHDERDVADDTVLWANEPVQAEDAIEQEAPVYLLPEQRYPVNAELSAWERGAAAPEPDVESVEPAPLSNEIDRLEPKPSEVYYSPVEMSAVADEVVQPEAGPSERVEWTGNWQAISAQQDDNTAQDVAEEPQAAQATIEYGEEPQEEARAVDMPTVEEPQAFHESSAVPQAHSPAFDIDDLLAEVSSYPIPSANPDWGRREPFPSIEKAPQQDVTTHAAESEVPPSVVNELGYDALANDSADDLLSHFAMDAKADHEIAGEAEPLPQPEPEASIVDMTPAVIAAETPVSPLDDIALSDDDPFDDADFELDMGAIALDLTDLGDDPAEPVADITPQPPIVMATPVALDNIAKVVVDRWVASGPVVAKPVDIDRDTSGLPFDPSDIAETDEQVEALAEMDVPDLPVDHDKDPIAHPDYEIDIDTEMAKVFSYPSGSGMDPNRELLNRQISSNPAPGVYAQSDNIDEFERALEEDFRRSLAADPSGKNEPARMTLKPDPIDYDSLAQKPSRRPLLLAGSAAVIVMLGSVSVYAWFFHSGPLSPGSNAPRISKAANSPLKIVPDDKGGQTVPNQDKAVYDKVAGASTETPTQQNLVSSTEEPVDVVQKTLVPENLPMDDDNIAGTPTEDTVDPRLLPEQAKSDAAPAARPVNGVEPRKVRTMIVKPDGTLVAREEPVAEPVMTPAVDQKEPAGGTPAVMPEAVPTAERLAAPQDGPVEETAMVASVPVPTVTPAGDAAASGSAAAQTPDPAVTADASQEPVEADTMAQTAAVSTTATEPSTDDTAVAAAAVPEGNETPPVRVVSTSTMTAPVPEARPADQPVNVVSTVTDQGGTAQNTQVAAAEPQASQLPAGMYVIQVASLPSEAEAQRSYAKLSAKFADVIGGRGVDIKMATVSGKGTYYRVRIPAGTKQEAVNLCTSFKKAGGSCLVSR